jgi:hypothetical protein
VQLWSPIRPPSRFWGILFAALALCVFLWGLQYKLSLYDPPQAASHHVPMAKLLSKNEQSNTTEKSIYAQSSPTIKVLFAVFNVALFSLLIVCVFCLRGLNHRERVQNPSLPLQQALLESFFVRPPPVLT